MALAWLGDSDVDSRAEIEHCSAECDPDEEDECEVDDLDLEIKLNADNFRGAVARQTKRMNLSEYSSVAGAAVNQFIETFNAPEDPYARAALRFSPMLLMSPQPRGRGVEGFVKDPRVLGAALVAAIVVVGVDRNEKLRPQDIKIVAPPFIFLGAQAALLADVVDARGTVLPDERVTWESSDPGVVTIDPITGLAVSVVPAVAIDPLPQVVITATSGAIVRHHLLALRLGP
jgi:hypothetical protein